MTIERRKFFTLLASGLATPFILTACGGSDDDPAPSGDSDRGLENEPPIVEIDPDLADLISSEIGIIFANDSERVFPQSISSGDPTPSGVMLWTRVEPNVINPNLDLYFQVAFDENFERLVSEGKLPSSGTETENDPVPFGLLEELDYTVRIDLDGLLRPDRFYYYRFIYDGTASRTGRCRTAPTEDANVESLKFGLLSCQDYTNGYYGALKLVADDDSLDYIIHLGDFIYESVGDPSFQSLPFEDRQIILPSSGIHAMDLEDYRHLYRTYRSDLNLQAAMERHTWIMVPDDHETANDCYWDYLNDTLGAPDHPYTTDPQFENIKFESLNKLKLDSQEAWLEYVPARVTINRDSTNPHEFLTVYRRLVFGDLLELLMLDTRSYRTSHPCGEGGIGERQLAAGCTEFDRSTLPGLADQPHTILGTTQKEWMLDHLVNATTRYKVLGNQTLMSRLGIEHRNWQIPFNLDAWDGYQQERDELMAEIKSANIDNFIVLTGDMHSHMAANIKVDYRNSSRSNTDNFVGAEFMTPAITSSTMVEILKIQANLDTDIEVESILASLASPAIRITNPHIQYGNFIAQGYSTVLFNSEYALWESFVVDKNNPNADTKIQVARYKKRADKPWLTSRQITL
ncbi:MAG: alkaline phosphatase D family protein [Pseudomonadales bacterium]|nr:alkaline phosphatase D family protein [Pseudomonadales bacterium]